MNQQDLIEMIVQEVRRQLGAAGSAAAPAQKKNILVLGDAPAPRPGENEVFHDVETYREKQDIGRYDAVHILKMTNAQLCDVAIGRDSTPFCCAVQQALLSGVPVYMAEDALSFRAYKKTAPARLYEQLEWYEKRLREEYGICPLSCRDAESPAACPQEHYDSDSKVITGALAESLCSGGKKQLCFRQGTLITPLARDVFHAKKIQLMIESAEREESS